MPTDLADIEELHRKACEAQESTYIDPKTGLTVFTEYAHLQRGSCCGCHCRHCPFEAKKNKKVKKKSPRPLRKVRTKKSKNKVYTRTGDGGSSSLFTGDRASKDDAVFEALGTIDELISFCGVAHSHCLVERNGLEAHLLQTMGVLMTLASHVATPPDRATDRQLSRTSFDEQTSGKHVRALEAWIDDITECLPDLRGFVLPVDLRAGKLATSALHSCRAVCRRCERRVLALNSRLDEAVVDAVACQYLNRLSDFFFVAARHACAFESEPASKSRPVDVAYSASEVAEDAKDGLRVPRMKTDATAKPGNILSIRQLLFWIAVAVAALLAHLWLSPPGNAES